MEVENDCPVGIFFTGWTWRDSGGWFHQMACLSCALALAVSANRSLILPDLLHYPGGHCLSGHNESFPFELCVDMNLMSQYKSGTSVITNSKFQSLLAALPEKTRKKAAAAYKPVQILRADDTKNCDHVRLIKQSECLYEHRASNQYLFNYCQKCMHQPFENIRPVPAIVAVTNLLSTAIGPFIHLHVRRGDRGKGKETEPPNIVRSLASKGHKPNSNITLWLGTDETTIGYFESVKSQYNVYTLATYRFPESYTNNMPADLLSDLEKIAVVGRGPAATAAATAPKTMNDYLRFISSHSLYSVQVDYLMKHLAADKVDNSDMVRTYKWFSELQREKQIVKPKDSIS